VRGRVFTSGYAWIRDGDFRSFFGKQNRRGPADPMSRAGNDCNFTLQTLGQFRALLLSVDYADYTDFFLKHCDLFLFLNLCNLRNLWIVLLDVENFT
jgi:hypothetical protein